MAAVSASGNPVAPEGAGSRRKPFSEVVLRNKLKALVVDGDRFCRMMEQEMIRAYGVETHAVSTGRAAIDLIASGATFNLIVIDMYLPVDLNGLETARQMRAMGVKCKMVGVTSNETALQAFLDAGVDESIEKPLGPDHLAPLLRELDGQ